MRILLIVLFQLLLSISSFSQVAKSVVLDSVMVQAVKRGFDVNDFIDMMKSDTSFLTGFRNVRNAPHDVKGFMTVYGRKKKIIATRYRHALQVTDGNKRWIKMVEENVTGKFYNRKEEAETYTAEIFDDIFFFKDTLPVLPSSVSISSATNTNNSSNINKLKKLIFNPGAEIEGVPLIGKRLAIFDDEMVAYYDYTIVASNFKDSISCYVFSCKEKVGAGDYPVLKSLSTWFDRKLLILFTGNTDINTVACYSILM
ncbi:MAG: hypothetical protein IPP71_12770 [Bacteroidetes bacterium]|nr:hypothetical protein [Bacteroidota bacterium]